MSWLQIAMVAGVAVGLVVFLVGVWALMASASQGDRYEELMAEQRRRHYTPKDR